MVLVIGSSVASKKASKQPVDPYNKGIQLLARREHSARELKSKLARRGITVREGMLFEGEAGWGEFSPFLEYDAATSAPWLHAALEAFSGWKTGRSPPRKEATKRSLV